MDQFDSQVLFLYFLNFFAYCQSLNLGNISSYKVYIVRLVLLYLWVVSVDIYFSTLISLLQ